MSSSSGASIARLSPAMIAEAKGFAWSAAARYGSDAGFYGDNRYERQLTGKLGEFGVADWFEVRGWTVERTFRHSSLAHPDLRASPTEPTKQLGRVTWPSTAFAIEVKTWDASTWPAFGRTLSARQLGGIFQADMVIWCRIGQGFDNEVSLEGWTWCADLAAGVESVHWRTDMRPELRVSADYLRPMSELARPDDDPLRPAHPRAAQAGCSTCDAPLTHGLCWRCAPGLDPAWPEWVLVGAGGKRFHRPTRQEVIDAHGDWPFRDAVHPRRLTDIALERRQCGFCFPRS